MFIHDLSCPPLTKARSKTDKIQYQRLFRIVGTDALSINAGVQFYSCSSDISKGHVLPYCMYFRRFYRCGEMKLKQKNETIEYRVKEWKKQQCGWDLREEWEEVKVMWMSGVREKWSIGQYGKKGGGSSEVAECSNHYKGSRSISQWTLQKYIKLFYN